SRPTAFAPLAHCWQRRKGVSCWRWNATRNRAAPSCACWSCTSPLRIIVSHRKPGTMPPYHPIVRGLFAMIPHQFYYQLVFLGVLWLFVMLYLAWPGPDVTTQPKPAKPITPRRQRSTDPTPFAGLTHKPPCALCAQEAAHPKAPPPVR